MKKPAAKTKLTEEAIKNHDEDIEQQNQQLNGCVSTALRMAQNKHMLVLEMIHKLGSLAVSGCKAAVKSTVLAELDKNKGDLVALIGELQSASVVESGTASMDKKVGLLNNAGATVADVSELIKTADGMMKRAKDEKRLW